MKMVFITQAVDVSDPGRATAVRWIDLFANHPDVESVKVMTLNEGIYELPENVSVFNFRRKNKLLTLVSFLVASFRVCRQGYRIFFVHQGGKYPIVLATLKIFFSVRIFQWKAHPVVNKTMYLSARFFDDLVFTCNKSSFPLALNNIRIVGHGINTDKFSLVDVEKTLDLVTCGRITPRKNIDKAIRLVHLLKIRHNLSVRLDIYGPVRAGDERYRMELQNLIKQFDLQNSVFLHDPVPQIKLPEILGRHKIFLNFSRTALDKATLEAMSVGLIVLSDNENYAEILTNEFKSRFSSPQHSSDIELSDLLYKAIKMNRKEAETIGKQMREIVISQHADTRLIREIIEHIKSCLK